MQDDVQPRWAFDGGLVTVNVTSTFTKLRSASSWHAEVGQNNRRHKVQFMPSRLPCGSSSRARDAERGRAVTPLFRQEWGRQPTYAERDASQ